ncbi:FadR family transcriptional regulator [Microbacterium bovistercoris]|uniref:FadR family transcriptional regulator n=1 Tax=Microbacterium bovistercoris TaxID=2293570 RepID=A0A371NNZ2_9MICO|nr:FCD domain-containing protein [Microbacterium bovistercoris]REJ03901.1 FadR family transcriptional regulator [Microbacterium bovistercoris]
MRQTRLHDEIVERWGSEIGSGRRPADSRIVMEDAIEEFGASRSAIREAVRVLESVGMVQSRQRVGITVTPVEQWSPYDSRVLRWRLEGPDRVALLRSLSELRSAVEPLAARLAAERATPEQCGALTAALVGMASTARAASDDEYLAHDVDFHSVLLEASGNVMLTGLRTIVTSVLEGRTHHAMMPTTANAEALRLHGEVVAAVQAGDGDLAERSMRAIVTESTAAISAMAEAAS